MTDNEKIVQIPAEFDNVIDNIFRFFCGMNLHKGKKMNLQHMTQHSSKILEDVNFWCPVVLFHLKKLFL